MFIFLYYVIIQCVSVTSSTLKTWEKVETALEVSNKLDTFHFKRLNIVARKLHH